MLADTLLAENNQHMNRVVYSELAVATVVGTYHRLVKSLRIRIKGKYLSSQYVNDMMEM